MSELNVKLIHAGSSQAKGKVERLWNTLHDRQKTEFRVNKITTFYLFQLLKERKIISLTREQFNNTINL